MEMVPTMPLKGGANGEHWRQLIVAGTGPETSSFSPVPSGLSSCTHLSPLAREVPPVVKRNGIDLYPRILGSFPQRLLSLGFRRLEIGTQTLSQLFPVLFLLPVPARGGKLGLNGK